MAAQQALQAQVLRHRSVPLQARFRPPSARQLHCAVPRRCAQRLPNALHLHLAVPTLKARHWPLLSPHPKAARLLQPALPQLVVVQASSTTRCTLACRSSQRQPAQQLFVLVILAQTQTLAAALTPAAHRHRHPPLTLTRKVRV